VIRRYWWVIPPALIAAAWAWTAGASYLYLSGMGYADEWAFPYNQVWLEVADLAAYGLPHSWLAASKVGLHLFLAIGLATLPFALLVRLSWRGITGRVKRPSLYGKTGWADETNMRRGGVNLKMDI
jgi:hypothetical protein